MFDIFGFNKGKKSKNSATNEESPSHNDDESYEFPFGTGPHGSNQYPSQPIVLSDKLIRGDPNSMYPSLNPNAPWASQPNGPTSINSSNQCNKRTCSPIDNVPFSILNNGNGNSNDIDEDELEILDTLNRAETFIQSTKYDFEFENSILRETID